MRTLEGQVEARPRAFARTWVRHLLVLLAAALLAVLAGTSLLFAGEQSTLPRWLQPDAPVTAFVATCVIGVALSLGALARHHHAKGLELPVLGITAAIALGLGLSSTARCTTDADRVLSPVWHTMTLFVGTTPDLYGPGDRCAGGVPLALQVGRFAALAVVFGAAIGLAGRLLTDRVNNVRDLRAEYRSVVIGVNEASLPLIRTLVDRAAATGPLLALSLPEDEPHAEVARAMGATVRRIGANSTNPAPPGAPNSLAGLARFLLRRAHVTAECVWVMDADPVRATQVARDVQALLSVSDTSRLPEAPRIVVRMDDRLTAQRLRSEWVVDDARRSGGQATALKAPIVDPVCTNEVTAAEIVGRVASAFRGLGDYALIICGDTPLAEAVASEVAARMWESDDLHSAWRTHLDECANEPRCTGGDLEQAPGDLLVGGRMPAEVILLSRTAAQLQRQVVASLPRAQHLHVDPAWRVVDVDAREAGQDDLAVVTGLAFVVAEPLGPDDSHLAARLLGLAREGQTARIWIQLREARNPKPTSLIDVEEIFVANVLLDGEPAEDSWTRAARHAHERYRRKRWAHPEKPTRKPWWAPVEADRLAPAVRADNLAAFRQLLRSVRVLGYTWSRDLRTSAEAPFTPEEWESIWAAEYARWRLAQVEMGPPPDPGTCPEQWPGQDATAEHELEHRSFTMDTVSANLAILQSYGYTPIRRA